MTPGGTITLFLCGDVMTGRGIDQVLPHPSNPRLHEPYVTSAVEYVALAENNSGRIPKPVDFAYIWGDALAELDRVAPDVRIVNLETSITTSEDYQPKGIHYRMHPANTPCLMAARIDCCVLANNHVLDWGREGLADTLTALRKAGLRTAGAGATLAEAQRPAAFRLGPSRLLVFAAATEDSGVPRSWAATPTQAGIALLPDLSADTAAALSGQVRAVRRPGDLVVFSIHWGENWGYPIPPEHRDFAHGLVDLGAADVIHGHSSHHPKAIEVYKGTPVLYGCGDFLNDYEGISGYETYRAHLVLMYFVTLDTQTRALRRLTMVPLETRRFRLRRAGPGDVAWLRAALNREGQHTGTQVVHAGANTLELRWRSID